MVRALFLDCDDCLYQNGWRTERRITNAIRSYLSSQGIEGDRAFELYEKHGTTLKGLLSEGLVDNAGAEAFLQAAHDIDYGDIQCDAPLSALLGELRLPTWIFTAGTREHAQRCIDALGLSALRLQGIVDVRVCKFESKHAASSFDAALQTARASDPSLCAAECCLVDDSERNIQRAHTMGWTTVLVGPARGGSRGQARTCHAADHVISNIHELPSVLPQLFSPRRPILDEAMGVRRGPLVVKPQKPQARKRARHGKDVPPAETAPPPRLARHRSIEL